MKKTPTDDAVESKFKLRIAQIATNLRSVDKPKSNVRPLDTPSSRRKYLAPRHYAVLNKKK